MLYSLLQWVHVLAAIIAFGTNITYFFWGLRAAKRPEALAYTMRGISVLDNTVANPAYAVAGVTGLILVYVGGRSYSTPWIALSIALFALVFAIGGALATPAMRKQAVLAEAGKGDTDEYRAQAKRVNVIGTVLVALVAAIVYLMVVQPALWG